MSYTARRRKRVKASIPALMVQKAPRGESDYGPSSVGLTVMHTDKTALWPSLCHIECLLDKGSITVLVFGLLPLSSQPTL